jgi:SAM-dependent methyltransferase
LAVQLRAQAEARFDKRSALSIVDVGCGAKPYEEILGPYAAEYVGVDYVDGQSVDVVAPAEKLPFEDARFDGFVCTQVLEHVEEPHTVLSEASRVLRPGGVAFVSTHGVANYHPNPDDYWRWTHAGLARLFETTGDWATVDVYPNGGTAAALAYLVGRQLEAVASKAGFEDMAAPLLLPINALAWRADRRYWQLFPTRPPDLAPNYLAVAERSTGVVS